MFPARSRLVALEAVVLLVTAGCAPESTEDPGPLSHSVRDSAGLRIVENQAPAWAAGGGWSIIPEPAVEIGVAEGAAEYMLFSVGDAARMSDGRIAVVNGGSHEVRFYDTSGSYLGALGREGEGPGEFRAPWRIHRLAGDTLVVWDMAYPGSLNLFDEAGGFLDRTPIDRARLSAVMPQWFAEGGELLPDGRFIHHLFNREAEQTARTGPYRTERGWVVAPADASRVDTVGFFPGSEQFGYEAEGQVTSNGLPFGRDTYVTGGGSPVHIYVADSGRYEIQVFSATGALEMVIRRDYEPIPVTDDDIQAIEERYREFTERVPEAQRGRFLSFLDAVEYPQTKPALGTLHVDLEGNLWVFETQRTDGEYALSVFDGQGVWLGRVALPTWLQIKEIGADYVLGTSRDGLGIEKVVLYELLKTAG